MSKDVYYDFGNCEVSCDGIDCKRSTEMVDSTDYSEINEEMRSRGYMSKKIDNEWYDFCSERCYRDFINKYK